jgi:hypothetical protein
MSGTPRSPTSGTNPPPDMPRRLGSLLEGLTIGRIVRADGSDLVIDMTDGTRLVVHAAEGLDISVS